MALVSLLHQTSRRTSPLCDADFLDWRSQKPSVYRVTAFSGNRSHITDSGAPGQILGDVVAAEFDSGLGVQPPSGHA